MRNNREVCMPGPAPPSVEAGHNTRMGVWQKVFSDYRKENCSKKGEQNISNLSLSHQLALKSLGKRVAKVEIVILEANKGKRFVVVDQPTYLAMANDHTHKDIEVSKEEIRQAQRILSHTAKAVTYLLGTGQAQSHRNYGCCMDNAGSEAEDPPNMKILPKVHKGPTPQGHPQSRPVVTAASVISSRAGDAISDFLEPLVQMVTPRMEERSTEEVLSQLEEADNSMQTEKAKGLWLAA